MRVRDIFDIAKNTELKQIIVGEQDDIVYSLLNMALIEVYGRFNILVEEQLIVIDPDDSRYRLLDNSQRVLQVYGKNNMDDVYHELPLNDINHEESVFTPQPYVLHVPRPLGNSILSVMLSVIPPIITKDNIDTVDLIIPPQLMEPIVNYMGYRAYISMNGDEQTENSSHYRRYVRSVEEVRSKGLVNYTATTNLKIADKGFPGVYR